MRAPSDLRPPLLRLTNVARAFPAPGGAVAALREASFEVMPGEFALLTGPSGAGKTTLLNLLALLDTPTAGRLWFDGQATDDLSEAQRNAWRAARLGMVFQRFCLLPHRTALENVLFRFRYLPVPRHAARARALAALESVGLAEQVHRRARLLSAGEMQRVAIARAIAHPPRLLLADEPTGNLDQAAAEQVLEIFRRLHTGGLTIVMVTHNEALLKIATRHLRCRDGCVEQSSMLPAGVPEESGTWHQKIQVGQAMSKGSGFGLEAGISLNPDTLNPGFSERAGKNDLIRAAPRFRARPAMRDLAEGLTLRPGRMLLVLGALAAGFAALTLLLSALSGLRAAARTLRTELGAEVVAIVPAGERASGGGLLTEAHLRCLSRNFPAWSMAGVRRFTPAPGGAGTKLAALAASPALAELRGWRPVDGRLLDGADELNGARCAVVSAAACARNGWRPGAAITVGGQVFTLVGILPDDGAAADGGAEGLLVVPLAAWPVADARLDMLLVRGPRGPEQTAAAALALLRQPDLRVGALAATTPEMLLAGLRRLQRNVGLLAGGAAGFGLFLGAALLTTLLGASVRDRTLEIGLRRALGAGRGAIAALFVAEACLLTAAAADFGLLLALPAARLLSQFGPVPFAVTPAVWLLLPLAGLVLGALAAWSPARAAARLPPAETLRDG